MRRFIYLCAHLWCVEINPRASTNSSVATVNKSFIKTMQVGNDRIHERNKRFFVRHFVHAIREFTLELVEHVLDGAVDRAVCWPTDDTVPCCGDGVANRSFFMRPKVVVHDRVLLEIQST
jgi:hypothetical protein